MKPPVFCTSCGREKLVKLQGRRAAVLASRERDYRGKFRAVGSILIHAYQCSECKSITEWNEGLWETNMELPRE